MLASSLSQHPCGDLAVLCCGADSSVLEWDRSLGGQSPTSTAGSCVTASHLFGCGAVSEGDERRLQFVAAAASAAVSLDVAHTHHRLGSVESPQVGCEVCIRAGVVLYTGSDCAWFQVEVGQLVCCADSSVAMCH